MRADYEKDEEEEEVEKIERWEGKLKKKESAVKGRWLYMEMNGIVCHARYDWKV